MAYINFIPKIEYKKFTNTGDTLAGSSSILNINTANIEIGMIINCADFPAGTSVLTVNVTNIVVSENSTGTNTGINITSFFRLSFRNAPQGDPLDQRIKHNGKTSISKSGRFQTLTDFIEEEMTVKFFLMNQTEKDDFQNFLISWAYLGHDFSYFIDEAEEIDERIVQLQSGGKSTKFKIQVRNNSGYSFFYEYTMKIRRVIG